MKKSLFLMLALGQIALCKADETDALWLEAEEAQLSKCELITDDQYSGQQAVRCTDSGASIRFDIELADAGKYIICVAGNGIGGAKIVNCTVNGGTGSFSLDDYAEVEVGAFMMKAGKNTITITPAWTWYDVDYLRVIPNSQSLPFDIAPQPVDPEATDAAQMLYGFLLDNFGQRTISGIMTGDMGSAHGDVTQHDDVKAVYKKSGQYPALVGFDFMNATGLYGTTSWYMDYTRASVELAKDTWRRGGIPAFTWHWRDPSRSTDAFYSDSTPFKASQAMLADGTWDVESPIYAQMVADIDVVADYMLELQQEGMACIFRPLHEASGGWFWWGREGAEVCKAIYRLIFDEMTQVKGVHNVLWVWNPDPKDVDWNPGDERYDIVSADIYNNSFDYSSNYVMFDKLKALTGGRKIIALSENGPIPDIELQAQEEAMWSWWMPWYQTWNGGFVDKTRAAEWQKCMNDPRVITLADMRDAGWCTVEAIAPVFTPSAHDAPLYDLQGHRLHAAPRSGAYIQGNKVIIK